MGSDGVGCTNTISLEIARSRRRTEFVHPRAATPRSPAPSRARRARAAPPTRTNGRQGRTPTTRARATSTETGTPTLPRPQPCAPPALTPRADRVCAPHGAGGGCSSVLACPAESLLGQPRPAGENPPPAHRGVQHSRAPRERLDGRGCAVAFEEEDDLALADEDVVSLEPQALDVEGRPLLDEPPGRLGRAAPDRNNDGNARPRRPLGAEPGKQIGELAEQAHPAQGGDEHPLAGGSLKDERLVAVDPFTRTAPDLHRGKLVERDPEPIGFIRPVQDEVIVAESELAD